MADQYTETFSISPAERGCVGGLIGKRGARIQQTRESSGTKRIYYEQTKSQFVIVGTPSAVRRAKQDLQTQLSELLVKQDEHAARRAGRAPKFYVQGHESSAPNTTPVVRQQNMFSALTNHRGRNIEDVQREKATAATAVQRRKDAEEAEIERQWAPKATKSSTITLDEWSSQQAKRAKPAGPKTSDRKIVAPPGSTSYQKHKHSINDDVLWPELVAGKTPKGPTKAKGSGRKGAQVVVVETAGQSHFVQESRTRHRAACAVAQKAWEAKAKIRSETPDEDPELKAKRRAQQEAYMAKREAYMQAHPDAVGPKRIQILAWSEKSGFVVPLTDADLANIDQYFDSPPLTTYMAESA